MFDISLIIVSWNAKLYLRDCLKSIRQDATLYQREVIVVDNASSDGSPEMVAREFPWVCLLRNSTNTGFSKANNIGIHHSQGRYVALVNSDVIVKPGCVDSLVSYLDTNLRVGVAGPRVLSGDGSIQPSCSRFPTFRRAVFRALALDTLFPTSDFLAGDFMPAQMHSKERRVDVVSGCFLVARREAVAMVGLLDERFFIYSEDVDWCKRFRKSGWQVVYYPAAEAIHFGGASSANDPERFSVEMQKADLIYWRKHHGALGGAYYRAMLLAHQLVRLAPRLAVYAFCPGKRQDIAPKINNSVACLLGLFGQRERA